MGTRLFLYVFGSALVGLGVLGYFFYTARLASARDRIAQSLSESYADISRRLTPIETSMKDLAGSARVLHRMRVTDPNVYRQLVFEEFKNLDLALSIGLGQAPNRLVPNRKWYYPFFYRNQPDIEGDEKVGTPVAGVPGVLFADLFKTDNYPERGYYQQPIEAGKGIWLEPYRFFNITMTAYILPFFDDKGDLLGVARGDVSVTTLGKELERPVIVDEHDHGATSREVAGIKGLGYFAIVSNKGSLLAYSQDPAKAQAREDKSLPQVQEIPNLGAAFKRIQGQDAEEGIFSLGGEIWAYRWLKSTDWWLVAAVPEGVIVREALLPVGLTVGVAALLLAGATLLFVNQLNQGLQPILDECGKLSQEGGSVMVLSEDQDEIQRLESAFFGLLEQIRRNEQRIRDEVARTVQAQEELRLAAATEAEAQILEAEVGSLLDVVSQMEEGDLTVQAQVSDRATGLVADTLNRLAEQLAATIAGVLVAAREVASGARDLEEAAQIVANNTVEQAKSVARGQELTEQVAEAARTAAAQTERANQALMAARQTSDRGRMAIEKLIEGIEVLQVGTGQIVQKMKTLGEFVGLAEQFVQDQGQIASLTQVLAINATLVAARAAEQRDPKQFIGVAREFEALAGQVNALATQTNEGLAVLQQRTAQIQAVVSAVDGEVQQLGNLVQGFTTGVQQSSEAFTSVQAELAKAVEAGRQIVQTSMGIASASASTANYMSEIAKLAERTAELTRNTRRRSENMEFLAQQLLSEIGFFRVPEATLAKAAAAAPKLQGEGDRPLELSYSKAPETSEESMTDAFAPAATSEVSPSNLEVGVPVIEESPEQIEEPRPFAGDGSGLRAWKIEFLDEPSGLPNGSNALDVSSEQSWPGPEPFRDPSPMTQIFQAASRQVEAIFTPEPPSSVSTDVSPEPTLGIDLAQNPEEEVEVSQAKDPVGAATTPPVAQSAWEEDTQIELPDVGTEVPPFDFGQFQNAPNPELAETAFSSEPVVAAAEPAADCSAGEPEVDLLAGLTPPQTQSPIQLDDGFEMPEISFEPEPTADGASLFDMLESELEEGDTKATTGLFEEIESTAEVEIEPMDSEEADPFREVAL
ncbi:MAG: methyl-accepting chemotaxis protein [Pseudanabaenaceae cyanobacterium]